MEYVINLINKINGNDLIKEVEYNCISANIMRYTRYDKEFNKLSFSEKKLFIKLLKDKWIKYANME
jgi:hypothetical protein